LRGSYLLFFGLLTKQGRGREGFARGLSCISLKGQCWFDLCKREIEKKSYCFCF
jgi:hypothetical protein